MSRLRISRLEKTVETLVARLDAKLDAFTAPPTRDTRDMPPMATAATDSSESSSSTSRNPAPILLIKDAASNAGVRPSQADRTAATPHADVLSTGLVDLSTAYSLLGLFHTHYGRWVKFPDNMTPDTLLQRVRRSPLLICSILLIAVRHSTQELADRLAPKLFQEAKRLVASALLDVWQTIEHFQAALILSLWSTSIDQTPLSIDSWLLTGYALQQAVASPVFSDVLRSPGTASSIKSGQLATWCLWNHLCLAHLQVTFLKQSHVDQCLRLSDTDNITNFETRMVAEVDLYWKIYQNICEVQVNLKEMNLALRSWQHNWAALFNQPRSQFLQMGFHFAYLLAYYQSLKSPRSVMSTSTLSEMIRLSRTIINLAIDTADDRTRHLTDQIYHLVTFSALTLTQITHSYESKLRATEYNISDLDDTVIKLINWLRSVGMACHVSHLLSDIVLAHFKRFRPRWEEPATGSTALDTVRDRVPMGFAGSDNSAALFLDPDYSFSELIGTDLFGMNTDVSLWPEWDQISSHTDGTT
ncbi:hypothetical protein LIA77_10003 [Sarocladium implicatum]|nr:hypothetical protein LIA77_10003 [Sarocladium implicatum]